MKPSEIQKKICRELGISSFAYNKTMFNSGMEYLKWVSNGWEEVMKLISYNDKFWQWWNNQFYLADLRLLNSDKYFEIDDWVDYHSPDACITYPDPDVFDSSYECMINDIKKEAICL